MGLIIFKAEVSRLKNGSIEPNVDWQYAPKDMNTSVLYSLDKKSCIVFLQSDYTTQLESVLIEYGFQILTGTETKEEFEKIIDIDYDDYTRRVYMSQPGQGFICGL